jgi:hypothetical protein
MLRKGEVKDSNDLTILYRLPMAFSSDCIGDDKIMCAEYNSMYKQATQKIPRHICTANIKPGLLGGTNMFDSCKLSALNDSFEIC